MRKTKEPEGRPVWKWDEAHEVGHFIGEGDKYNPLTGKPYKGWEGNIMAEWGGTVDYKILRKH